MKLELKERLERGLDRYDEAAVLLVWKQQDA